MEEKKDRLINYNFFHWGPLLYQTKLTEEELNAVKKLCSKEGRDYRQNLAGLLKHEHEMDVKKLFPIIAPYINSYCQAYVDYSGKVLYNKVELVTAWVNYMTKGEANPLHTHDDDLSFVLFTEIPKGLLKEYENHVGNTKPGLINFIYTLEDRKELLNEHSFFPTAGSLFIFPACLHHYVNPFRCEGERVSVSGNLTNTFVKQNPVEPLVTSGIKSI
tara:strand:+ start:542 stop:1192 length:651 start_codon:yes stop_codon:yes gene_type:complete